MEGIDRLEKAMQYLRTEVHEELPAQQILLLMTVSKNEGITQLDLGKKLNMPGGSISRNVKRLSQFAVKDPLTGNLKAEGFGLIDTRPDLEHRLRNAVFLTEKGKRVIKELDLIMIRTT